MSVIKVVTTSKEEYVNLLELLNGKGYVWLSGQLANEPPTLFSVKEIFNEVENLMCLRILDTDNKTIGFTPMEVFTAQERRELLVDAIDMHELESALVTLPKKEES